MNLAYRIKTATESEICMHLKACNQNFIPFLDTRVDVQKYSKKIFDKSITFESWDRNRLVGMVAAYFNDVKEHIGYITSVSVAGAYLGKHVASALLDQCLDYAVTNRFLEIRLEVSPLNATAIHLYRSKGFGKSGSNGAFLIMKRDLKDTTCL